MDVKPKAAESAVLMQNIVMLREIVIRILSLIHAKNSDTMDASLRLVLDFWQADRISLAGVDSQTSEIFYLGQAGKEGIAPLPFLYNSRITMSEHSWMIAKLQQGEVLMIDNLEQLPPEGIAERWFMEHIGTRSYMVAPVILNGSMTGFLTLECIHSPRTWAPLDAENLRVLASLLSTVIEQEQAKHAMVYSSHQLLKMDFLFQYIYDNLAWAVELYDEKGYLIDLNPASQELYGYTREQVLGINLFANPNIPEDHKVRLRRGDSVDYVLTYDFNRTIESGYFPTVCETKIKHICGYCHPVKDAHGEVIFYLSLLFDDTENYRRDEELKRGLAKLNAAIDTGNSFLWEFDAREETGDELYEFDQDNPMVSPSATRRRKNTPRTLRELFESIHPDDISSVVNHFYPRMMRGELDAFTATYRRILGGKIYWFTSNVRVDVYDTKGKPIKIVCYTTDITKEKEQELELLKAQEADQLKSAFMGNISHEVRTPLNSIVGFSNYLVDLNSTPETETFREIINKNNTLLLQLIDDILDFSKIELGTLDYYFTDVSVKEVFEEVISTYSPMIQHHIQLAYDGNLPAYMLFTDRKRMRQVLSQLLGNSIKYTQKGKITLSYEQTVDNQCLMKLEDTGIGLSENSKKEVFNTFYKENEFNQGSGLGLPIAKAIVEAMGGKIGVESVQGQGSVFWFTLPLKEESPV